MAASTATSSIVLKSSFLGAANVSNISAQKQVVKVGAVTIKAEKSEEVVSRRASLALFAGASFLALRTAPAEAAYGESANIFGKTGNTSGFIPYKGDGFSVNIPAKWNPSKEIEFPGTVIRYEDNFDATNNFSIIVVDAKKSSVSEYGTPEEFLNNEVSYLLGTQSYAGKTSSEGGFAPNSVVTASLLDSEAKTVGGKEYYKLSLLTRTADGDEGGKHQLISATVADGKLYILKIQAGDKRWFKGAKKFVEGTVDSFVVA